MVRKTGLKSIGLSHFSSYVMSYLIYTDVISKLLDLRLVDPGSTMIHVDAYDSESGVGGGATRPLPKDSSRKPNSRTTPQGLDQRSKMEEVVPKIARRRGSDTEQARRR